MKRLNAKQLLVLPIGKYHDGNGLYLSIYSPGRGKDDITQKSSHNLFKHSELGRFF